MKTNKPFTSRFKFFIQHNKLEIFIFFLIILLASFLRLYKIREFVVFLGDEGRDALVVKQILYDRKLTLLGPTASVGGFYLGPIYYYFMIPFMIMSGMDPVGPAVMVALMGITTVALLYWLIRIWYGRFAAVVSSVLYAVSPGIVTFSRSSWNPNPMPLFSLISIFSLYFAIQKQKLRYALLAGIGFGIAIQLHYLGLILGPILAVITFSLARPKNYLKLVLFQSIGFLAGASLYLAFEIRHGFPNIRSVLEFVSRFGGTTGPRSLNIPLLFVEINRFTLESILGKSLNFLTKPLTFLLIGLAAYVIIHILFSTQKFKPHTFSILTYWFVGMLGISMYKGQFHYHYFEFLFPVPFLLLGMSLSFIKKTSLKILISIAVLISTTFLLAKEPIWVQGSNLIDQTKQITEQVIELSEGKPFNFALITPGNSDHAYRFFLELAGAKPTPLEEEVTTQLIVVCEQEIDDCHPLGHPLWEIAGFGRAELDKTVEYQANINIFRLTHHPDSIDMIGKPAKKG